MPTPSVLLAASDRLVLDILRAALARHDITVVGEVESVDALRSRAASLRPAVVVATDCLGPDPLDAALPAVLGTGAKVVVVSSDPSSERLSALLSEGVTGYLLHDADPDEVAAGVLAVARGAAVLNPTAAAMVLSQWRRLQTDPGLARRLPTLTPRERDVLAALVEGLPTKGIAQRLSMATKTVENHKIRIFDKLGVRTQAHAVSVAISSGLIRPATAASS